MKISLRHRLLAVAVLGLLSCAISLGALGRILSLTHDHRVGRARELVTAELAGLHRGAPVRSAVLGMRGGQVTSARAFDAPRADTDEPTRREIADALHAAENGREAVVREATTEGGNLVTGARASEAGFVWVAYPVRAPPFLGIWRLIVASLTIATVLLVGTAIAAVVAVRRGAASLDASLAALAKDLRAPVPRPAIHELGDIADRIADLAAALASAQVEKERLGAELAQRERLAALGRVVTGVAHEVRNPLASIKLRVDLGRHRAGTPAKLAEELSFVSEEITRLDRLVADLLVLAGRRSGPRAPTGLSQLAERRAGLLRPWAEGRGVRIEVEGDATADLDADAVARAVDNLVRNAVEASPAGGTVRVEIAQAEGEARVAVLDRGDGVPAERAHELFEPFFTTKPEGTGLGLALSRAIAAAHGGTLTYERRAAETCFELRVPIDMTRSPLRERPAIEGNRALPTTHSAATARNDEEAA